MSTSYTKLNDLCEHLEVCKLGKISDEELFKQPPPEEDCPICFQRLPYLDPTGKKYMSCCGKVLCSGCIHAPVYDNQGNKVAEKKCAFCRIPFPKSNEEQIKRFKKRVEAEDPMAIYNVGVDYSEGANGYPQDSKKALELWHQSGELGYARAYGTIGSAYEYGRGVEIDKEKAKHYYEVSAVGGVVGARHNLGVLEENKGNTDRAVKHYMISAKGGYSNSLIQIKGLYSKGHISKDDYTNALRSYLAYLGEVKSVQRDKAASFDSELYRYY